MEKGKLEVRQDRCLRVVSAVVLRGACDIKISSNNFLTSRFQMKHHNIYIYTSLWNIGFTRTEFWLA